MRKGDVVKIMRGKYKKKQGRVIEVKIKQGKIYVEGIQIKKTDGSKVNVPVRASNLQIIELNTDDKMRMKNLKTEKMEKPKSETKEKVKEEKK